MFPIFGLVANLNGRQYIWPSKTLTFLDANLKGFTVIGTSPIHPHVKFLLSVAHAANANVWGGNF